MGCIRVKLLFSECIIEFVGVGRVVWDVYKSVGTCIIM